MSNYEINQEKYKALPRVPEQTNTKTYNVSDEVGKSDTYISPITIDRKGKELEPNCYNTCNNPDCICTGATCPKIPKKKPTLIERMKHLFEK